MKKFLVLSIVCCVCLSVFAQEEQKTPASWGWLFDFGIGASFGGNTEGVSQEDLFSSQTKLSQFYDFRVFRQIKTSSRTAFFLETGIGISEFQSDINVNSLRRIDSKFVNARIPLLLSFRKKNMDKAQYDFHIGPVYSLPIQQYSVVTQMGAWGPNVQKISFDQQSVGMQFGGAVAIPLSTGLIYKVGSTFYTDISGDIKNSAFWLTQQLVFSF